MDITSSRLSAFHFRRETSTGCWLCYVLLAHQEIQRGLKASLEKAQALVCAWTLLTTRKTGKAVATFSNFAIGASLFTGTWGRALGTPSKWGHGALRKPLLGEPPHDHRSSPAARTFSTQFTFSPSIDTRYRCPSTMATTTGSEIVRPDVRPVTSRVSIRLI
jgi:hypothetical protein